MFTQAGKSTEKNRVMKSRIIFFLFMFEYDFAADILRVIKYKLMPCIFDEVNLHMIEVHS